MSTPDFQSIQYDNNGKIFAVVHRNRQHKSEKFRLGDVLKFRMTDGEFVRAVMMKNTSNGAIFMFMDCLRTLYPVNMTDTNLGGFSKSYLRKYLNQGILHKFPEYIKENLQPFGNGDYLRIPTEMEIFGENNIGHTEPEQIMVWSPMTDKRKLIAFKGSNSGLLISYWLRNESKHDDKSFCCVSPFGSIMSDLADKLNGVRPVFKLKIGKTDINEAENVDE